MNEFRSGISTLLTIAGYRHDLPTPLIDELVANLQSITSSAVELRSAIAERISSCDMEVVYLPSGALFDPKSMDDSFGDGFRSFEGDDKGDTVLCTTHLGMKVSRGVAGGDGTEVVVEVLLKPKVALQSVAEDALGLIF